MASQNSSVVFEETTSVSDEVIEIKPSLCGGCLSLDRKVQYLKPTQYEIYTKIVCTQFDSLQLLEMSQTKFLVCFECYKRFCNMETFLHQVATAQHTLCETLYDQKFKCLSKLNISIKSDYDYSFTDNEKFKNTESCSVDSWKSRKVKHYKDSDDSDDSKVSLYDGIPSIKEDIDTKSDFDEFSDSEDLKLLTNLKKSLEDDSVNYVNSSDADSVDQRYQLKNKQKIVFKLDSKLNEGNVPKENADCINYVNSSDEDSDDQHYQLRLRSKQKILYNTDSKLEEDNVPKENADCFNYVNSNDEDSDDQHYQLRLRSKQKILYNTDSKLEEDNLPEENADELTRTKRRKERRPSSDPEYEAPPSPSDRRDRPPRNRNIKYICDYCGKVTRSKDLIEKHITQRHMPQICKYCKKQFKKFCQLAAHVNFIHVKDTGENTYCVICDKKFRNVKSLKIHCMGVHGSSKNKGRFKCDHCDKTFASTYSRRIHYNAVHLDLANFKCHLCPKEYRYYNGLQLHVKKVHLKTLKPIKDKICHICGVGFSDNLRLRQHIYTHTDERPFKCDLCSYACNQKYPLKIHLLKVHGQSMGTN